jgi:hypothetical protein
LLRNGTIEKSRIKVNLLRKGTIEKLRIKVNLLRKGTIEKSRINVKEVESPVAILYLVRNV